MCRNTHSTRATPPQIFVSRIARIGILTTTHIVHALDRQSIVLQAFDDEGNVFDTMRALPFLWQVDKGDNPLDPVLQQIKFSESKLAGIDDYVELERRGMESDRVAIEGLKCGVVNVSATLTVDDRSHPRLTATARITVVEPISLLPTRLVAMPCGEYQLHVMRGRYESSKAASDADLRAREDFSPSPTTVRRTLSCSTVLVVTISWHLFLNIFADSLSSRTVVLVLFVVAEHLIGVSAAAVAALCVQFVESVAGVCAPQVGCVAQCDCALKCACSLLRS